MNPATLTPRFGQPITGHLFTPYAPRTRKRVAIMVNDADASLIDDTWFGGRGVVVTDLICGDTFLIRRADCGSGCRCAAEIVE